MTLQRLDVFNRLWKKTPPQHMSLAKLAFMVQKFLGFKDISQAPEDNKPAEFTTLPDIEE